MSTFNPAVSAYIDKAEPFAQPILAELREIVHAYCPEVTETIKWSFPVFTYNNSILCNMAAFKQHCSFGFWLAALIHDKHGIFQRTEQGGMGDLGKIRSLADIPAADKLGISILEAMELIRSGAKLPKKPAVKAETALIVPELLSEALLKEPRAKEQFDNFSNSHKHEYIEWILEAKTESTRLKRLATTIENLVEGKSKEWKYQR